MRYLKFLFVATIIFFIGFSDSLAMEKVNLYLFYSEYCPHCAKEKEFLSEIESKYDYLDMHLYEVANNKSNDNFMMEVKKTLNDENPYVPYTVIGSKTFTGYSDSIGKQIEETIVEYSKKQHRDLVGEMLGTSKKPDNSEELSKNDESKDKNNQKIEEISVPVIGKINPQTVSLPVIAAIIGAVDGFNPCAMWVLLFLISMLLGTNNRKRMWIIGLTFLFTSALVYMLIMVAWLKITLSISSILWVKTMIALLAIGGGLFNLRNYYKTRKEATGCTVVDAKKRNKVFERIRDFTSQKSLLLALIGAILLAVSVNIVELACSAGLPLLFTQILAFNDLSGIQYWFYILIYIFFFLIDDIIIFTIAMITLKVTGVSNKYSKYSHLVGGIIMLIIGLLLIFKPEWIMFNF